MPCWRPGLSEAALCAASDLPAQTIDFRYKPPQWQTSICPPDDWQKTLVGMDGALLYDYPGKFAGFATKITAGVNAPSEWLRQELHSPRVPVVRTFKKSGPIEITEEAFAVAPPLPAARKRAEGLQIEKAGSFTGQTGWASPPAGVDPAFRNIAVGFGQPIHYRLPAPKGRAYTVVFGLCEGWHTNAAKRILDLKVEGRTLKQVDMIAEKGRNVPALFPFAARDENGDGWVDLEVAAATTATDKNTILNVLWVFNEGEAPDMAELMGGRSPKPALVHLDCSTSTGIVQPTRHDIILMRLRNTGQAAANVTPTLTLESTLPVATRLDGLRVSVGANTTVVLPEAAHQVVKAGEQRTELLWLPERSPPAAKWCWPSA